MYPGKGGVIILFPQPKFNIVVDILECTFLNNHNKKCLTAQRAVTDYCYFNKKSRTCLVHNIMQTNNRYKSIVINEILRLPLYDTPLIIDYE